MENIKRSKPWHVGLQFAGKTLHWLPTDTRENFDKLLQDPKHRAYFEKQGWLDPEAITYKINSEGFRCDEFEPDTPCIVALGCSYTVGIGLPQESIWPTLVGQALGLKVYNLAWGGSSADTCFRLANYWIPKLKPQVVCMLTPPKARLELLTDPQSPYPPSEVFMPMSKSIMPIDKDVFLKHWIINENNHWINHERNKCAVEMLAIKNQARFANLNVDDEEACARDIVGYARDFMHTGPIGHQLIAEKLLNKLQ